MPSHHAPPYRPTALTSPLSPLLYRRGGRWAGNARFEVLTGSVKPAIGLAAMPVHIAERVIGSRRTQVQVGAEVL